MSKDPKSTYYDTGGIETLDIIKAKLTPEQYQGYCLGNAIKYACRVMHKSPESPLRDAEKLANYSAWFNESLILGLPCAEPEEPIQNNNIDLIKRKMELFEQDIECLHMSLDNYDVPRSNIDETYSLWGLVDRYAEKYSQKSLLYKDILNMLGVNSHDGAIYEIKKLRETCGLDNHKNLPWIKNTGVAPDCKKVLAKLRCGEYFDRENVDAMDWSLEDDDGDITEYLILE
jgi:hypothetical protein